MKVNDVLCVSSVYEGSQNTRNLDLVFLNCFCLRKSLGYLHVSVQEFYHKTSVVLPKALQTSAAH